MNDRALLKTYIKSILLEEKPGGGLTDLGALRRVNKDAYAEKIKSAISSTEGDIDTAAKKLDIAPRTLYQNIEDSQELESFKDEFQGVEEESTKKR